MNLGYGSYERCSDVPVSVRRTRLRFLYQIRELAPQVMQKLHDDVFLKRFRARKPNAEVDGSKLIVWANTYHLNSEWCIKWATAALSVWASEEEARKALTWTSSADLVSVILFPESFPHIPLANDIERLREIEHILHQLGDIDFSADVEFGVHDVDGLPRNKTRLALGDEERRKYKKRLPPDRPPPNAVPDWCDVEMRPYWAIHQRAAYLSRHIGNARRVC